MKRFRVFFLILAVLLVLGLSFIACSADTNDDDDNVNKSTNSSVQKIYDELNNQKHSRAVIGLGSISTGYRSARVDKIIGGYSGYPDPKPIDNWDWTGVGEGDIKLDSYGPNGDGWDLWIFITIQGGDQYVVFANNDNADRLEMGVTDYPGQEGQVWFFRWE